MRFRSELNYSQTVLLPKHWTLHLPFEPVGFACEIFLSFLDTPPSVNLSVIPSMKDKENASSAYHFQNLIESQWWGLVRKGAYPKSDNLNSIPRIHEVGEN